MAACVHENTVLYNIKQVREGQRVREWRHAYQHAKAGAWGICARRRWRQLNNGRHFLIVNLSD